MPPPISSLSPNDPNLKLSIGRRPSSLSSSSSLDLNINLDLCSSFNTTFTTTTQPSNIPTTPNFFKFHYTNKHHKQFFCSLLHILLLATSSYLIINQNSNQKNRYSNASNENFCHYFSPKSCRGSTDGCPGPSTFSADAYCHLSRVNETYQSVYDALYSYQYLTGNHSLAMYSHNKDAPVVLEVEKFVENGKSTVTNSYEINVDDLGPVDIRHQTSEHLHEFFATLIQFQITFRLNDTVEYAQDVSDRSCMTWEVTIHYTDVNQSHLKVFVLAEIVGFCDRTSKERTGSVDFFIYLIVTILALILASILLVETLGSIRLVSERSERALRKTRILAMNPAKWLQT